MAPDTLVAWVSPYDFLSFSVPFRDAGSSHICPKIYLGLPGPCIDLPDEEAKDPPAVLEIFQWLRSFNLSYGRLNYLLLRLRLCPLKADDDKNLSHDSSIWEKYLHPVSTFVNRDLFDPSDSFGQLEFVEARRSGQGIGHVILAGFHLRDESHDWPNNPKRWNALLDELYPKRALIVGIFLECGMIHREDFVGEAYPALLTTNCQIGAAVLELSRLCDVTGARYGFLCDERASVVYDNTEWDLPNGVVMQVVETSEMTVRMMIANLIYIEGCKLGICEVHPEASTIPCRGALNQREIVVGEGAREEKQWGVVHELAFTSDGDILKKDFSSFDLFTMQRCEDAWDTFKAWRRAAEAEAEQSPLMPGMKLEVEWNGVENRHTLWRAQEDEYHRAIPEDSARIASRYMRPKDQSVQDLVNASLKTGKLWFEIVEAKRTGPRKYSQIFFGKICGRGPLLCLKLFDERYVPYPEDPKDPHAPIVKWYLPASERLLNLNFAADMIRREESVYDRLKHFQGSLIPHCYGFHVFILPGGWRFPGFFTEVIDAPSFGQCRVQEWPKEDQCDFVTRLRHCVRVLKFAGIEQTDWHGGQILCPLSPIEMARPESREIVFIDFAFARQRLGEHKGKPITHDEALLKLMLRGYKLDSDVINECWFEPADEEY